MVAGYPTLEGKNHPIPCKLYCRLPFAPIDHVILGVHGFCGDMNSSALRLLAEAMVPHGGEVLCFDFPAHGSSSAEGDAFTLENCKNDLLTVAKSIRRCYPRAKYGLFATSFGAYVALLCSNRLRDFRMVLRAPAVPFAEVLLQNVLHTTRENFERAGRVTCGFERKLDLSFGAYRGFEEQDIRGRKYRRPLLVFHGTEDDVVPYERVAAFCARQPNARLVTVEGADHRFKRPGDMERVISEAVAYFLET